MGTDTALITRLLYQRRFVSDRFEPTPLPLAGSRPRASTRRQGMRQARCAAGTTPGWPINAAGDRLFAVHHPRWSLVERPATVLLSSCSSRCPSAVRLLASWVPAVQIGVETIQSASDRSIRF